MKRFMIVAAFGLGTSLVALSGPVLAQPVDYDDASGSNGTCNVSGPPSDQMVVCSDLRPGKGVTVVDPPKEAAPKEPAPTPEPAPETDAAAVPETTDMAVATATDQDADNAPDELEPGLGLDPTNPDTDADGVADGDEINIYGTDPLSADSDGDGVSDGEELFGIHTDPLAWDGASTEDTGASTEAP